MGWGDREKAVDWDIVDEVDMEKVVQNNSHRQFRKEKRRQDAFREGEDQKRLVPCLVEEHRMRDEEDKVQDNRMDNS